MHLNESSKNPFSQSVALFPGQGSQFVGMGKDLFENFPIVRQIYEEASDAIHVDLKKLCFNGPEDQLILTENTQPCLLVTSVAAYRAAQQETGFLPGAVAGHSLGEYSALVASRCLDLTAATKWVKERGAAMQRAVPAGEGSMAAILGLEDSQVEELCREASNSVQEKRKQTGSTHSLSVQGIVEPANFNAPGQVVIAGSADGIQEAISLLKADTRFSRGKAIPLQVSAPFHCRLMYPARERMAELFSKCLPNEKPKTLDCPYIPNRTARLTQEASLVFELLTDQVDHPVLWKQSIQALLQNQFTTFIEFGPGKVLSGLIKKISTTVNLPAQMLQIPDSASIKNLETLRKTV